jgi:hypothetical protein
MGPSRGVRAGGSAGAASRRHRAVSHEVSRRSGDSNSDEPGRVSVPIRPARRFDAQRVIVLRAVRQAEAGRRPPMRFRASSETCPCSPAPQRRAASRSRRPARPAMLPLLGFRALRHSPGPADPHEGDESLRRRVPRAGFGYPHRDVHHRSSRRAKRRSVHGLHPSGCSPRARAVLLSEPMPS